MENDSKPNITTLRVATSIMLQKYYLCLLGNFTMKNTDKILDGAKRFLNSGLGFADNFLANQYIQRLKSFLPKPLKIMIALKNNYEKNGLDNGIEDIATDLFSKTLLLGDFIKAYYKGDYRAIDSFKLFLLFSAIVYLVSPLDLIPNWLGFIGLFDEILLVIWVIETLNDELNKFQAWKSMQVSVDIA
jgi:uncharacterized membrane protein YkvA (DUF1232 family)